MDIPPPPTTNLDPDLRIQQIPKQLPPPFTNGVLKRHKPRHHHSLTPPVVISYKECLKNHAASMGGHAVDGCGEFMPSPTSTPTDPTSLKCAACGCHRNFHRRDPDDMFHTTPYLPSQHVIEYQPHHRHHPPPPPPPPPVQPISIGGVPGNSLSPADSPSPPPISSSYYPSAPHMLLALSSAPPENTHTQSLTHNNALISGVIGSNSNGKKRFRTKFTQDQKQKMHDLAERVGWKMQKKDEDIIIGCCNEIGVEKGVFKVWMHNNKMTLGNKKESGNDNGSSGGGGCGVAGGIDFLTNHQHQHQPPLHINTDSVSSGGGVGGNVIGTNGSSSSS